MFYDQIFQHLLIRLQDSILTVTLNNPEQLNAISLEMIDSLTSVLRQADFDPKVRVIILTGQGSAFCAGGDIKAMAEKSGMFAGESNELRVRYMKGIQQIPKFMEDLSTPVIAAVNGAAIGAGCDLALMCDIRLGTPQTRFGETFVKLGLVPGDGGSFFLQRIVGYAKAMELSLTAEILNSDESLKWGLVSKIVPEEKLMEECLGLAKKIASYPPVAVQMTKRTVKSAYGRDLQAALDLAAAYQGITQRTQDHFLALEAMKTKTQAAYKGS